VYKKWIALLLTVFFILSLQAWKAGNTSKTHKTEILVSSAISLKDAFSEIASEFSKDNPDISIKFNFGASGTLQSQIEQGAPVDIFASAGQKQMDQLVKKDLVVMQQNFTRNSLVLIAPSDNPLKLSKFEDIKKPEVVSLAIGDPASVPAGQYAVEVLDSLNLLSYISQKLVLGTDVRQVLQWVESGNAQAGIVYKSDAYMNRGVKFVDAAPSGSHKEILYPIAVVKASKAQTAAQKWLNYILTDKSQAILAKYGFDKI